jgi:hypothetical protein
MSMVLPMRMAVGVPIMLVLMRMIVRVQVVLGAHSASVGARPAAPALTLA